MPVDGSCCDAYEARIATLLAQLAAARSALEPFEAYAREIDAIPDHRIHCPDDATHMVAGGGFSKVKLTFGDFRRVIAAFDQLSPSAPARDCSAAVPAQTVELERAGGEAAQEPAGQSEAALGDWPSILVVRRHDRNAWYGEIHFAKRPTDTEIAALSTFLGGMTQQHVDDQIGAIDQSKPINAREYTVPILGKGGWSTDYEITYCKTCGIELSRKDDNTHPTAPAGSASPGGTSQQSEASAVRRLRGMVGLSGQQRLAIACGNGDYADDKVCLQCAGLGYVSAI